MGGGRGFVAGGRRLKGERTEDKGQRTGGEKGKRGKGKRGKWGRGKGSGFGFRVGARLIIVSVVRVQKSSATGGTRGLGASYPHIHS
jgi:hypothetical protein